MCNYLENGILLRWRSHALHSGGTWLESRPGSWRVIIIRYYLSDEILLNTVKYFSSYDGRCKESWNQIFSALKQKTRNSGIVACRPVARRHPRSKQLTALQPMAVARRWFSCDCPNKHERNNCNATRKRRFLRSAFRDVIRRTSLELSHGDLKEGKSAVGSRYKKTGEDSDWGH
jgi:hypothetical protein